MSLTGLQLGHYRLLQPIGSGAMGEVYLAEDTRITTRQVAVKVIRYEATPYPDATATREVERLFQREMQVISKLDHPSILSLFDFGEEKVHDTHYTYMVMPYRAEGSLGDWLRKQGGALPSPADVSHLLAQAADALQYAHDQQLVHQDVKPSNFLIRLRPEQPRRPDLLLADFGIAKISSSVATSSQNIRGTPSYMPPEQWNGHPVPASDQYALAIMAYRLLTGQLPFRGSPVQIMQQHNTATPVAPSKLNPRLTQAQDSVLLRALAKKPEERFPSITAFAQAFEQTLEYKGALRATLAISRSEAISGTSRSLNLPGKRQVMVYIPPDTQHGQEIHLSGEGEAYYEGGPRGPLILTVSCAATEEIAPVKPSGSAQLPKVTPPPLPAVERRPPTGPTSLNGIQHEAWNPHQPAPQQGPTSLSGIQHEEWNRQQPMPPQGPTSFSGIQHNAWNHQQSVPLQGPTSLSGIQSNTWNPQQSMPPQLRARQQSALVLLLVIMAALVVLGGSGWFVYATQIQPDQQRAAETAQSQTATVVQQATVAHQPDHLTATAQTGATATVLAANPNPYPPHSGKIALIDPLNQPYLWQNFSNSELKCQFADNSYHIIESKKFVNGCPPSSPDYSDFTFEVQMTMVQGYCGGVSFRGDADLRNAYFFEVCSTGRYYLTVYQGTKLSKRLIMGNPSSAIHLGLNQPNLLAIVTTGSQIDLYVNNQKVDSIADTTFTQGRFFLLVENNGALTEAAFSKMRLWTN